MKKLVLSILSVISLQVSAQTVLLQENFNSYNGTSTPTPAGFGIIGALSLIGNYTTGASSGPSGPNSFKFQGATNTIGASLVSPAFSNGNDSLSFWIKGNGTNLVSKLTIYQSSDSTAWTVLDSIKPLPTNASPINGVIKKYALLSTTKWVKFEYYKGAGNLAFDDVTITQYPTVLPPVASFSSDAPVCPSDSVHFANTSTNATTWAWNFGDATTSTLQNPVHYYTGGSGSYTVTLIANPGTPTADTIAAVISVITPPNFSFTYANAYINAPTLFYSTVNTSNSTCTVNAYMWTFGDAASGSLDTSVLANPSHNYAAAGQYHVKLRVQWSCMVNCGLPGNGWDSLDLLLTVAPNPEIIASFAVPPSCEMQCVQFADAGTHSTYAPINSYVWSFGDASPDYTGQTPPCHNYPIAGTYIASLTITDDSSHTATSTQTVVINPMPLINIQSTAPTTCAGTNNCFIAFAASNMGMPVPLCTYAWDFGDGSAVDTSPSPCHTYVTAGTYTVNLFAVSCNGCIGLGTFTLTVDAVPGSNFSSNDCGALMKCFTDLSSGSPTAWDWRFGDSNTSASQNPSHTYASAGNYTVTLKVTNMSGCVDSVAIPLNVPPVIGLHTLNQLSAANVYTIAQSIKIVSAEKLTATVAVYTLTGEKIAEELMSDAIQLSIDMSGKSEGLYLVIISGKEGKVAKKVNLAR